MGIYCNRGIAYLVVLGNTPLPRQLHSLSGMISPAFKIKNVYHKSLTNVIEVVSVPEMDRRLEASSYYKENKARYLEFDGESATKLNFEPIKLEGAEQDQILWVVQQVTASGIEGFDHGLYDVKSFFCTLHM